jgi:hypothetical protein
MIPNQYVLYSILYILPYCKRNARPRDVYIPCVNVFHRAPTRYIYQKQNTLNTALARSLCRVSQSQIHAAHRRTRHDDGAREPFTQSIKNPQQNHAKRTHPTPPTQHPPTAEPSRAVFLTNPRDDPHPTYTRPSPERCPSLTTPTQPQTVHAMPVPPPPPPPTQPTDQSQASSARGASLAPLPNADPAPPTSSLQRQLMRPRIGCVHELSCCAP